MVTILVVLPRPIPGHSGEGAEEAEGKTMGVIGTPIAKGLFVKSLFECQVGDIIVLEENEQISVREGTQHRGISMFCLIHKVVPKTGTVGENTA